MKWKVDSDVTVVTQNLSRRCGSRTEGEDWNVYWANVASVKAIFHPDSGLRLTDNQLINHFPNHYELTRKDLMVKNIKRYLRDMNNNDFPDFVPTTYLLPADYSLFVEEFRRCPSALWIMKPYNAAQGRGIFIVNKLAQIKKWSNGRWAATPLKDAYVISRYVEDPLLVGGKKFDLRLYVLVTSFRPLRVYLYAHGFARFCNVKYNSQISDMNNPYVHLTNVAIQKHGDDYNANHGGKWHLQHLKLFVEAVYGAQAAKTLFEDIEQIVVHSLKATQNSVINDKHCFECYGYDILIDAHLKPWLVEVNASPSLSTTTRSDKIMKTSLLRDVLDVVLGGNSTTTTTTETQQKDDFRPAFQQGPCEPRGDFKVLYDEALEAHLEKNNQDNRRHQQQGQLLYPRDAKHWANWGRNDDLTSNPDR